jgi:hypothetical protein
MSAAQVAANLAIFLVAAAVHGLILRFAVRLMLEVRVDARTAYAIIAAEYSAAALLLGVVWIVAATAWKLPVALAFTGLVITGAVLIGRWISLPDGAPLGVGNGLLVQFMQVPMVIPLAILLSFFIVPPG